MRRWFVVLILFPLTLGCSTLMRSPEPRETWATLQSTSCTSSRAAPMLDAVGGGALLGWGIVGLAFGNPAALVDVLVGSLLAWSSSEGTEKAESCVALRNFLATDGKRNAASREVTGAAEEQGRRLEIERMKLELEREKLELEKLKQQMSKERK